MNNKTNKGNNMSKMIKTITILAVLIGNVSLFQSSANAGWVNVGGYQKSNGTYVAPHIRTSPDAYTWNNLR
jgi:hypothetical protein